jgi:alkanesulfonate monooxygenase SsuD/methylene tetrahydromethanopterin reductase-like flavin-dependent oxidoreductase (luciferase family)
VVFSSFAGVELVRRAVECLREAARAAGRSATDLVVSRLTPIAITDDPRSFLQSLRPLVARDLSIPGRGEQMLAGTRWSPEILEPIRAALHTHEHLERGIEPYRMALLGNPDLAAAVEHVPLDLVQEVAIAGSVSACRDRLADFADAGVDRFIISSSCALSDLRDLIQLEVS